MTRTTRMSLYTSTDIIEHALLHGRQETWHCDRCDEQGDIGPAELELALESRLVNARALIGATYDPNESTALMRTMSTLDYLIREALQLCALSHWAGNELPLPLPQVEMNRPPLNQAFTSIANQNPDAMHGA
jgi:hypothetical protein